MNINPLNVYVGSFFRSATAERSLKVSSLAVEPMFIHHSADGRTVNEHRSDVFRAMMQWVENIINGSIYII